MKIISTNPEVTFDDVLFLAQKADFDMSEEKTKINLKTKVSKKIEIDIPILSSPMPGVTEAQMAIAMAEMGGMGYIHGFDGFENQLKQVAEAKSKKIKVAATVGELSVSGLKHIGDLLNLGTDIICIYTYHSLNTPTLKFIKEVRKKYPKAQLSTGPIATKEAVVELAKSGIDSLNVGIGPGSHCTTRLVTGVGRPQLSAVLECSKAAKKYKIPIISEGGIKYPGDLAKALAFGASAVMIGGMFSGTEESPGEIIKIDGKKYKNTWGMCSKKAITSNDSDNKNFLEKNLHLLKSKVKNIVFSNKSQSLTPGNEALEEGVEALVEYKGSVKPILNKLTGGLRRSLWYQGAHDIAELQEKARLVLISDNTNLENIPRI